MSMIGKLDTRIEIKIRKEIGDFSNEFSNLVGGTTEYTCVLKTWADVDYQSSAKKFNNRAVGDSTGTTSFLIRNPNMELEKDHYIDAKGYRYKVEGTRPADGRHRFIVIDTIFIGKCSDEG